MSFSQLRAKGFSRRMAFFASRMFNNIETLDELHARFEITQAEFYILELLT